MGHNFSLSFENKNIGIRDERGAILSPSQSLNIPEIQMINSQF